MATDTFHCPECGTMLKYSPNLQPGTVVRCPQCEKTFPVPDPAADPAPRPAEPPPPPRVDGGEITTEPGAAPRPPRITDEPYEPRDRGRRYPDEDDEDYPRDRDSRDRGRDPDAPLSNRYEMDINKWFNIATAHYSSILGPAVGFVAICFALQFVVNNVLGTVIVAVTGVPLSNLPLTFIYGIFVTPALQAGFLIVCLKQLDGRRWSFADFFGGFGSRHYLKLIVNSLLGTLVTAPATGLLLGAEFALIFNAPPEVAAALAGAGLLIGLVTLYFATRMFFFATPLILDRGFGAIEAIKGSWELTAGHFWGAFGVYLLLSLLAAVGVLACCVGALFSIPFALLVYAACYLDVAGIDPPLRQPATHTQWRENG